MARWSTAPSRPSSVSARRTCPRPGCTCPTWRGRGVRVRTGRLRGPGPRRRRRRVGLRRQNRRCSPGGPGLGPVQGDPMTGRGGDGGGIGGRAAIGRGDREGRAGRAGPDIGRTGRGMEGAVGARRVGKAGGTGRGGGGGAGRVRGDRGTAGRRRSTSSFAFPGSSRAGSGRRYSAVSCPACFSP